MQATKTLQALSQQVGKKNIKRDPMTDGEVSALDCSLKTVLSSLLSLAQFKEDEQDKVVALHSLPISRDKVAKLQACMPQV